MHVRVGNKGGLLTLLGSAREEWDSKGSLFFAGHLHLINGPACAFDIFSALPWVLPVAPSIAVFFGYGVLPKKAWAVRNLSAIGAWECEIVGGDVRMLHELLIILGRYICQPLRTGPEYH